MIDLTSALYLGLAHPSAALAPWAALTLGRPAALGGVGDDAALCRALAARLGTERAALATSTVHAMIDLEALAPSPEAAIVLERGAYPIARWGAERAAGRGRTVRVVGRAELVARRPGPGAPWRGALVVVDGTCPACGEPAPLRSLVATARRRGAVVLVDDTQAVGVRGPGGGGSLRWHGLEREATVTVVASLAKGWGVPVCVVAGSERAVARWLARSETRVHASPPSAATLRALEHALAVERRHGDRLRARLAVAVARFRAGLADGGCEASGGAFPVQALAPQPVADAVALHERLLRAGVRGVVQRAGDGRRARLCFALSAAVAPDAAERAGRLAGRLRGPSRAPACACGGGGGDGRGRGGAAARAVAA